MEKGHTMDARSLLLPTAALLAMALPPALASSADSTFAHLRYRSIGPAVSGGRITAVAGSDLDPWLYYAGGADGGVFKSTDGGITWNPIFDDAPVAAIGAIALDPHNQRDVWVGTGESNPRNTVEAGDGLWHSLDGGVHWSHAGLDAAFAVSSIVIDPRDSQHVIVGTSGNPFTATQARGAYVTRDGGKHWRKSLYVDENDNVSDLAIDPSNSDHIFAGVWEFHRTPWSASAGGTRGGIFESKDGGDTWHRLTGGGLPTGMTGRIGLSISATNSKRIYAIIQSREAAIWRSDDGGKTWKSYPKSLWVGYRGYYFSKVFVDPHDSAYVIDLETLMSRSTDAGTHFELVDDLEQYDHHALWWSRDGRRIINGADTGIGISTDGGKTWITPRDLPVSQVYHLGLSATFPYRVCIGLQDVNSWCGPGIASNSVGILNRDWTYIAPGDGNVSVFDPQDPNLVWSSETERSAGQIYLTDMRSLESTEISPSQRFSEGMAAGDLPYRFDWTTPIAFTYTTPVRTLVGGNVLFETTDRGKHWSVVSPDLTRNDKSHQQASGGPIVHDNTGAEFTDAITSIATTPLEPSVVWVGTDDGLVQLSVDGMAHWTNVSPPSVAPWGRAALEPGHIDPRTAYVTLDRHMSGDYRPYLFKTTDFGQTWTSLTSGLPNDLFLRCVREDSRQASVLFVCTQRGVWMSIDGGRHWQSLRLNMPASAVYDIEIAPETGDLLVGTQGRGVWILDDLSPLEAVASGNRDILLSPRDAYRYFLPKPYTTRGAADFIGTNAPYGASLNVDLTRPLASLELDISNESGDVIRHLHLTQLHTGFNRAVWDLRADGPVIWKGAAANDIGPTQGPQVAPGTYSVRVSGSGIEAHQSVRVRAVGDDAALSERYAQRSAFLQSLFADLSTINRRLNEIDPCLASLGANCGVAVRERQLLTAGYTSQLQMVMVQPQLRERVKALIERLGASDQAPTQAQLDEAASLHRQILDALNAR